MEFERPLVLVADDDRAVRFALCEILEDHGFRTVEACDGEQALRWMHRCQEPDIAADLPVVVLLDLDMPLLDGFGVLEHVAGPPPPIPTIVVSGALSDQARLRVAVLGAARCISKPFSPEEIVAATREMARRPH